MIPWSGRYTRICVQCEGSVKWCFPIRTPEKACTSSWHQVSMALTLFMKVFRIIFFYVTASAWTMTSKIMPFFLSFILFACLSPFFLSPLLFSHLSYFSILSPFPSYLFSLKNFAYPCSYIPPSLYSLPYFLSYSFPMPLSVHPIMVRFNVAKQRQKIRGPNGMT